MLALGAAALLAGLTGALVLLGLPLAPGTVRLAANHGLLMTLGFLGTLISLERAVALGRPWGYLAPLATGLGGLALIVGLPTAVATVLFAIGGAAFVAIYGAFDRIEVALHTRVQAVGAFAWLVAALLLIAGRPTSGVVPWLAGFLVLTIAGERLELARLGRLSGPKRTAFVLVAAVFCGGVVATLLVPDAGVRLAGVGLLGLAAWLARNDLARRTVRMPGVTRFIALSLLIGYAWLAVAGGSWLAFGSAIAGRPYDAMLHALFLGFVVSMVFGHAPVILPAVLGLPLPYRPWFYGHLGLLHAGLLIRIVIGDLLGWSAGWQLGGVLNVVAVLLFLGGSVVASVVATRRRGRRPTDPASSSDPSRSGRGCPGSPPESRLRAPNACLRGGTGLPGSGRP
jgi:hypothetical protein